MYHLFVLRIEPNLIPNRPNGLMRDYYFSTNGTTLHGMKYVREIKTVLPRE